ncbi:MAG: sugar phosphate isomerase/epimerase [Gemmatimonadaceae bacterium]
MPQNSLSRREFLASSGAAALLTSSLMSSSTVANAMPSPTSLSKSVAEIPPIGIELYALRTELARDLPNTLRTTKQLGYELVEFYAPYMNWTLPYAKVVRLMMDDLGLRCRSTHNELQSLVPGDTMTKSIELNQILGTNYIVLASPSFAKGTTEQYKSLADQLAASVALLSPHGLTAGFHNHDAEWMPLADGVRPMDLIANNTPAECVLQLDVGTCVKAGADPVAWVKAHKGRIKSVHLKDWAPGSDADEKGYRVLFGEGTTPWKPLIAALESVGGVEFYLMEQEGSRYSEFDTAKRCLESWKKLRMDA